MTGALLATMLGWAFLVSGGWGVLDGLRLRQSLHHWSYDLPFLAQDIKTPEAACILSMDEESHRILNQNPTNLWDRELHIRALNRAFELGAEAVVFDIVFMTPWPDPTVDHRLADAMRSRPGRVVLATLLESHVSQRGKTESITPFLPTPPLESAAVWGVAELNLDADQTVRHHPAPDIYTNLAWKAAEAVGRAPQDQNVRRWIRYYGPRGTVHRISYHRLVGDTEWPEDYFAGQVVFVGRNPILRPSGTSAIDEHRTPYTRLTGETSTGVEVQATLFLNLVDGDWIEEMPIAWQWLVLTVCGLVVGGGLTWCRPWFSFWIVAALFILCVAAAFWLFWGAHLWFPWLIIAVVQLPAAFVWSVVSHSKTLATEKHELEERLETTLRERSETGPVARSARSAPATTDEPAIPDHELLRRVGRGAYGEVWLARDVIGTYHAVKIVHRKTFSDERPFEREFEGIRNYTPISRSHPGLVHILHVGRPKDAGYFYYVMEAGDDQKTGQNIDPERYQPKTLGTELQEKRRLPLEDCLELGIALADALEHLHRQELIHRDIKPSNIIYLNGRPKFTDIGLVTDIASGRDATMVGTQGYLAPEGPTSPASDIYALGKVLYEAALGQDPRAFPDWPTEMLATPPAPELDRFVALLWKSCDPEPDKRFASADEMGAALKAQREEKSTGEK